MGLSDTDGSDLGEFRARVEQFLDANCDRVVLGDSGWGVGSDTIVDQDVTEEDDLERFQRARAFRRALADAGLAWIDGPTEYGGAGLTTAHRRVFDEVAAQYRVPDHICFIVGLSIVAPTVEVFGTDEAKRRYLAGLYSGDVIGSQLFSEPDAGSDLAGVRSRAVRVDGGWRVSGQKVWSSGAHHSDVGEMLVRTDPDASKHAGLSMMMVDMHAPGVTIRPLRQITGGAEFNEVFLDEVFVSDADVLGNPGDGWRVANATLGSERESMGQSEDSAADPFERLLRAAQHFGLTRDPVLRQELANLHIATKLVEANARRFEAGALAAAGGAEASLLKLQMTDRLREIARVAGSVLGPGMVADTGEWGTYTWGHFLLTVPSQRIAGGTDEIMRNVIGERILGLQREPRPS